MAEWYTERRNGNRKDAIKIDCGSVWPSVNYGDMIVVGFEMGDDNKERVRIRFKDTGYIRTVFPSELKRGDVKDHSTVWVKDKIFHSETYGPYKVLNEPDVSVPSRKQRVDIKFVNTGSVRKGVLLSMVRGGVVRDLYYKSVCGVGYIGEGKYSPMEECGLVKKAVYEDWIDMLKRVYAPSRRKCHKTYREYGIFVCDEWHNFQNFAEWYYKYPYNRESNWALDKDLKKIGNKMYGPETCSYIPQRVNSFYHHDHRGKGYQRRGVYHNGHSWYVKVGEGKLHEYGPFKTDEEAFMKYKQVKESVAKDLAEEYDGMIDPEVIYNLRNLNIQPIFDKEE